MARTRVSQRNALHLLLGLCFLFLASSRIARAEEAAPTGRTVVLRGYFVDGERLTSVKNLTIRASSLKQVPVRLEMSEEEFGATRMSLTVPADDSEWVMLEISAPFYVPVSRKERLSGDLTDLGQIRMTRIKAVSLGGVVLSEPSSSDKMFLDTTLENLSDARIEINQLALVYAFVGHPHAASAKTTSILTLEIDDSVELQSRPAGNPEKIQVSGRFVYHQDSSSSTDEFPASFRLDIPVSKSLEARQTWKVRLVIPKLLTATKAKARHKRVFRGGETGSTLWVTLSTGEMESARVSFSKGPSEAR